MAVVSGGSVQPTAAGGHPITNAGAPSNGADEVQTITFSADPATTFKLAFDGHTTSAITWSATTNTLLSNVDTALEALPNIGSSGVTTADIDLSSGIGTISVTFAGSNVCKRNVPAMTVATSGLTGTITVATATVGTLATAWGAEKGALLSDSTNGVLYVNTGTAAAPTWTKVGSQS